MNQHTWARECLSRYDQLGLQPGNPADGDWEKAHFPVPRCKGGVDIIWLLHNDHQVQGLLQSEEYGLQCFFNSDVTEFLVKGPFVPGWFELWGLYYKWSAEHCKSVFGPYFSENGKKNGKANMKTMNAHPNTYKNRVILGKNMSSHPNTVRARIENNKRKSKPVLCVETGVVYPSTSEACRETGSNPGGICRSCQKGCRSGGYHWQFVEQG